MVASCTEDVTGVTEGKTKFIEKAKVAEHKAD